MNPNVSRIENKRKPCLGDGARLDGANYNTKNKRIAVQTRSRKSSELAESYQAHKDGNFIIINDQLHQVQRPVCKLQTKASVKETEEGRALETNTKALNYSREGFTKVFTSKPFGKFRIDIFQCAKCQVPNPNNVLLIDEFENKLKNKLEEQLKEVEEQNELRVQNIEDEKLSMQGKFSKLISDKIAEIKIFKIENETLTGKLDEIEMVNERLRLENTEIRKECAAFKLASQKDVDKKLGEVINEKLRLIRELQELKHKMDRKLFEITNEKLRLELDLQDLKHEMKAKLCEMNKSFETNKSLFIRKLKNELEEQLKEIAEQTDVIIRKIKDEKSSLQEELMKIKSEKNTVNTVLKIENQKLIGKLNEIEDVNEKLRLKNTEMSEEFTAFEVELEEETDKKLIEITNDKLRLERELQELKEEMDMKMFDITNKKLHLERELQKKEAITRDLRLLESELCTEHKKKAELGSEIINLGDENRRLMSHSREMENNLEKSKDVINYFKATNGDLKQEILSLKEELSTTQISLQSELNSLSNKLTKANEENNSINKTLKNQSNLGEELHKLKQSTTKEIVELKLQVTNLTSNVESVNREKEKALQEASVLQEKYDVSVSEYTLRETNLQHDQGAEGTITEGLKLLSTEKGILVKTIGKLMKRLLYSEQRRISICEEVRRITAMYGKELTSDTHENGDNTDAVKEENGANLNAPSQDPKLKSGTSKRNNEAAQTSLQIQIANDKIYRDKLILIIQKYNDKTETLSNALLQSNTYLDAARVSLNTETKKCKELITANSELTKKCCALKTKQISTLNAVKNEIVKSDKRPAEVLIEVDVRHELKQKTEELQLRQNAYIDSTEMSNLKVKLEVEQQFDQNSRADKTCTFLMNSEMVSRKLRDVIDIKTARCAILSVQQELTSERIEAQRNFEKLKKRLSKALLEKNSLQRTLNKSREKLEKVELIIKMKSKVKHSRI